MTFRHRTEIYWHGWNVVAGYLAGLGLVSALAAWFLASSVLGETELAKAITFGIAGVAVTCGDLIYRGRNPDFGPLWRFASPFAGGWVVVLPAWVIGFGMVATAISYRAGVGR